MVAALGEVDGPDAGASPAETPIEAASDEPPLLLEDEPPLLLEDEPPLLLEDEPDETPAAGPRGRQQPL